MESGAGIWTKPRAFPIFSQGLGLEAATRPPILSAVNEGVA
jgi:hypothetical protein